MITIKEPSTWQELQSYVSQILKECNFSVEIEKTLESVRGKVEVDVYAEETIDNRKYLILCECKYWKTRVTKNVIHAFRTIISDIGANIGYIIAREGFQSGAFVASELTNIKLLTWVEFQQLFENSWYDRYFSPTISKRLDPLLSYIEPILPRWFDHLSEADKEQYLLLKQKYFQFGWTIMLFTPYTNMVLREIKRPSLPLLPKFLESKMDIDPMPRDILEISSYREFLEAAISYGEKAIEEFRAIRNRNNY